MGIKAVLFAVDGKEGIIELNSFTDLQNAVGGGMAELVTTDERGVQTWANENAMMLNMPVNECVSFNNGLFEQQLLGPVVSVREDELETLPYKLGAE